MTRNDYVGDFRRRAICASVTVENWREKRSCEIILVFDEVRRFGTRRNLQHLSASIASALVVFVKQLVLVV